MTKIREPGSVKDAVNRCVHLLGGVTRAAAIVGRSERLVAAWTDPDDDRFITGPAIIALDHAAYRAGHGHPITTAITAAVKAEAGEARGCPLRDLAAVQAALGPCAAGLIEAMDDGRLDERERRDHVRALYAVRDEIDKALAHLDPPADEQAERRAVPRYPAPVDLPHEGRAG